MLICEKDVLVDELDFHYRYRMNDGLCRVSLRYSGKSGVFEVYAMSLSSKRIKSMFIGSLVDCVKFSNHLFGYDDEVVLVR